MQSITQIFALLQAAVMLLTMATNQVNLPQSFREQAIAVSNYAISMANSYIQQSTLPATSTLVVQSIIIPVSPLPDNSVYKADPWNDSRMAKVGECERIIVAYDSGSVIYSDDSTAVACKEFVNLNKEEQLQFNQDWYFKKGYPFFGTVVCVRGVDCKLMP